MFSRRHLLLSAVVILTQCLYFSENRLPLSIQSFRSVARQQSASLCRERPHGGCCVPSNEGECCLVSATSRSMCCCDSICKWVGDCCNSTEGIDCRGELPATCAAQSLNNTSSGCCDSSTPEGCTARNTTTVCYCDRGCHEHGDCCSDITDVGCFPTGCVNGGKRTCCRHRSNNCRVRTSPTDHCYCDRNCFRTRDCCPDMPRRCSRLESSLTKSAVQTSDNLLEAMEAERTYERVVAAYLWRLQQASRVRSQNGRN